MEKTALLLDEYNVSFFIHQTIALNFGNWTRKRTQNISGESNIKRFVGTKIFPFLNPPPLPSCILRPCHAARVF